MADGAQDLPWDDQTELFVRDIDAATLSKYNISVRELMLDPDKFAGVPDILDKMNSIKAESDSYFQGVMKDLEEENADLEEDLKSADALYNQVSQVVTSRANLARVPLIKAADIDVSNSSAEIIYLDKMDQQVDALMTKLINNSYYIGDLSTSYRKYMIGSWLFSGNRSYIIASRMPESPVTMVENAQVLINTLLDTSTDRLQSLAGSKEA